ncbi:MAG: hypothetical protein ACQERB_01250 [Promethearchaeati archaeon]
MVNWESYPFNWFIEYWNKFVDWFIIQPLFAQILVIVGIFAIIVATIFIIYYICLGVYKFFHAIYKAILGEEKPIEKTINTNSSKEINSEIYRNRPRTSGIQIKNPKGVHFCSECGVEFSDKITGLLLSRGMVYCDNCGKKYETKSIKSLP